ncbi:F-box/WD repeat-containing protein TBL1XR1, partial [Biomphalaria glabrata]
DGAERTMESLSLIDAVMPDVVESRKQAITKSNQVKTETSNTNGDNGTHGAV